MGNAGIAGDDLARMVNRIEKLDEERKAIGEDIAGMYAEAKSKGYDVKVLRALIAERKKDPTDLEEAKTLLDIYRDALANARQPSPMFGEAA